MKLFFFSTIQKKKERERTKKKIKKQWNKLLTSFKEKEEQERNKKTKNKKWKNHEKAWFDWASKEQEGCFQNNEGHQVFTQRKENEE